MEKNLMNIVIVTCSGDRFLTEMSHKAFDALIKDWGDCRRRDLPTPLLRIKDTYLNLYHIESITIER